MVPVPSTDEVAAPADGGEPEVAAPPPPRQCGRCRLTFAGDPTLAPRAQPGWWLCPPCRDALLGGPRPAR